MGCGGSSDKGSSTPPSETANNHMSYDRRPKISVRVGPQAKKLDNTPRVVFIFGGPGSRKGRIVDDLKKSYNFQHIYAEDIILTDLPRKVANVAKVETVKEIKELLESDPSHVTIDWMLSMVERRIERNNRANMCYLVDLIPNLKFMLKLGALQQGLMPALERFEEKYPISFALNLAIPADKVLKAKQVFCSTPEGQEKMKESGGQGDEADSGRIQKRAALFETTVKYLIEYFAVSERLVTVDVTCGVADLIWHRVHQLLCDLDFHPAHSVNTVLLFAFEDSDASGVDLQKFEMEKVELRSIVENPNDSVDNLLSCLRQHIDNQSRKSEAFVVTLTGTSLTHDAVIDMKSKILMFTSVGQGYLESYLPGTPSSYIPRKDAKHYKAVCSVENEAFLFPLNTQDEVCTLVANTFTHCQQS